MPDPITVAFEHLEWLRREGVGLLEAGAAIGEFPGRQDGWDDLIIAYAQAYERLRHGQSSGTNKR